MATKKKKSSAKKKSAKRRTPRAIRKKAAKKKAAGSRSRARSNVALISVTSTPVQRALVTAANPDTAADAIQPEQRPLTFKLQGAAPEMVRVTLDSANELVLLNGQSWPSRARSKGTPVQVRINLLGMPGQTATIAVTNGSRSTIRATIPGTGANKTNHDAASTINAHW
ncbi:hypothetical protein [Steroidobacter cummioxidans]|uniref:hypothetical protein n=1 Tax=Steroidobacter cummioxidans TaxID=1803913 RepID=UPI000E3169F1|nr:hypothetical protein [Steroidobacter cummioxidans]